MDFKVAFQGRSHLYTKEEIALATEVMQTAIPLTQGQYQKNFEAQLRQKINAEYAFILNSATSGLEMAAQLCQFEEGDEVIIPSHTFTSSAYPFIKKGAKNCPLKYDFI